MNVEEILKTLTLEEKAGLCQGVNYWNTKEIPEKGIPSIMVTDGPHGLRKQVLGEDNLGVNDSVPATCFPSAASICNSWNKELIHEIGEALGEECLQEEVSVLLGPGANIKRSPLCGRNFEYFSEDPYLSSQMATNHVLGVQSKGIGTSLKHFAVNNQETRRMTVNAKVDERTLREIYLASFENVVKEAKPWTIMSAYNRVNGEFCCENHHLLKEILRDEWGYEGVVVSDWGAANDQVKGIKEGFDLRMPYAGEAMNQKLVDAVESGELSEKELDASVRRILNLVKKGTENKRQNSVFNKEEHHKLAEKAAMESIVLLKNEQHVLPLNKNEKIAVIGSLARFVRYQGGGSSHVHSTVETNILETLDQYYPDVIYQYARGYRLKQDIVDETYEKEALEAAKESDKILLFLGLPNGWESEGFDRTHLRIPDNQVELLKKLSKTGKPIVIFLFAGAPVEMPWEKEADAIMSVYTAGQAMPSALLKLAYGEENPCGKLAETYPLRLGYTPCSLNYPQLEEAEYQEGIFVGYRYYDKKDLDVAYPFGHGLSYTTWEYSNLSIDRDSMKDTDQVHVSVDIKNTGNLPGKEIVQLYVGEKNPSVARPIRELKGFEKIFCNPGEKKTVGFTLDKRSFAYYNTMLQDWYVESDTYVISIGASSRDLRIEGELYVESTVKIKKLYDEYITLGELRNLPQGQKFMQGLRKNVLSALTEEASEEEKKKRLEDEENQEDAPVDYTALGKDIPLIKMADMTAGALSYEMVKQVLDELNTTDR